jgi:hypothetical protein
MIKKNLFNKILKLVSILSITLTLSLMTFSFTVFAFVVDTAATTPKAPANTTYTYKGKGAIGNKITIQFDTGEIFTGTVNSTGYFIIDTIFPRIKGNIQISEALPSGVNESNKELAYDITKFNGAGFIIGPVIFSGTGEVPETKVDVTFEDGTIFTALVDALGNYQAIPVNPVISGNVNITTQVGTTKSLPYDGGITSLVASQVPVTLPATIPGPKIDPNPTPAPDSGIKPVATAASTPTKATVRSGGFLQIAGIIALFTVILAILIINKKFKR